VWWKKLALTKKHEPTLSGLLALARTTIQWIGGAKLGKKQVSLLLLPTSLVLHTGHVVACEEALTKSPYLDYVTDDWLGRFQIQPLADK